MSTILDALRKVERERDPSSDAALDAPTISAEPRRRRSFPIGPIVACALVGFGGGAVLSWLLPATGSDVRVAALPEPPSPPDIAVPRPPLRAEQVAPAAPVQDQLAAVPPAAPAPPVARPPVAAERAAAPPPVAAPPPAAPAEVAPPAVAADKLPAAPVPALPPKATTPESGPALAAIDPKASVLEPSPFKPSREAATGQGAESAKS